VRPLPPTALIAEQLEAFRATLYIVAEEETMQDTAEDSALVPITCNWCGTWMPMPRQANIAIIDTHEAATAAETLEKPSADKGLIMQYPEFVPAPQLHHIELVDICEQGACARVPASSQPHIARARHHFCPTFNIQYPEHVPAAKVHTFEIVPAFIDEAVYRPTIDDFLQPSLCSLVCEIRYGRRDLPLERQLRKQRVAALRARWVDRPFTGLAWLDK